MCGYSAYPRQIDFKRFRAAADRCGALLVADIAHIAGLVAGGSHPSPFPECDIVTTTTHKTLRGPRGGLVLTNNEELAKQINKAVFPGTQGGPLMHVIAGKAVCFGEALTDEFKHYAQQVVVNAKTLARALMDKGWHLSSNGTDNHLMLINLARTHEQLTGRDGATWLESAGIITNKNTVMNDQRSPFVTSGIRLGTPALTTRGMTEDQMTTVAGLIDTVLRSEGDSGKLEQVKQQVQSLCADFPMPH